MSETLDSRAAVSFPAWKKILLTVAGFLLVIGIGFKVTALATGGKRSGDVGGGDQKVVSDQKNLAPHLANGFDASPGGKTPPGGEAHLVVLPGDVPVEHSDSGSSLESWSPAFLKGGLSFFVGFCMGYALRTFFRVSAVVIGLVCLAVFAGQYFGVVKVDWDTIQGLYDRAVAAMKSEAGSFQAFVAGTLPSAGMASLGIFTGFKRN